MRLLRVKEQVEICEQYEERLSHTELAIIHEISIYQIKAVLTKYKVPERTEPL